ncbi:MAG: Asp-tRNA(Asn)/Glu-tRNA(Gln) amidotransferase subunit GatB [Magnetococcales bacterium]|nr:Asp-tRNA(Asn)/Glu-tRNA(Gln) amidotransferase subunit GatB [Magnetococcales bacterium]MBF0322087.1 Asp-tRNA(Asn)/Glu-tRNA(Gln) amidotransferase subunit GatB [Magnetococcales bacterium]
MPAHPGYEVVIGLEVHAQMRTQSKIFCGCSTRFGAEPNTQICPVCAAFPGVLPVLNQDAVNMAIRTGLAISGTINLHSEFSRKNYFYPDLPAGFQITQYELPIVSKGVLHIPTDGGEERSIGITRIHMEVDAGKNLHEGIAGASWVDLNRTGVPLMEIVSEPDLRSAAEAGEYLKKLRSIVRYLDVCDGNMEEGSFRCDANVSVRPRGQQVFGTRCELKNLNSIRNVMRAIDHEAERHIDVLETGGQIVQETRLWDAEKEVTRSMRGKEEAHDYRYFPEPDLPPLTITPERIAIQAAALPELPDARRDRFQTRYGLSSYDAEVLTASRDVANFFEEVVGTTNNPKTAANWVSVELLGLLNKEGKEITASPVTAQALGQLIGLVGQGTLSGKMAKQVFTSMFATGDPAEKIIAAQGLQQVSDSGTLEALVERVLTGNPQEVAQYRAGKTKLLGFFVGQIMKETQGQANPAMVNKLLKDKLAE